MEKIKKVYLSEFKFLKKNIMKIFIVLFVIFIFYCILMGEYAVENETFRQDILNTLNEMKDRAEAMNVEEEGFSMFLFVIMNNIRAMGITVIAGFLPFLFLPIFILIGNAGVVGGTIGVYYTSGMSVKVLISAIMPHGIIEIPNLVLCASLGTYLNICIIKKITKNKKSDINMKEICLHIAKIFVIIVMPLLIIASFVEGFITPKILKKVMDSSSIHYNSQYINEYQDTQ